MVGCLLALFVGPLVSALVGLSPWSSVSGLSLGWFRCYTVLHFVGHLVNPLVAKSIAICLSLGYSLVGPLALKLIGRSFFQCVGPQCPSLVGDLVCPLVRWFFSWSLGQWVSFSVPLLVGLFVGGSVGFLSFCVSWCVGS